MMERHPAVEEKLAEETRVKPRFFIRPLVEKIRVKWQVLKDRWRYESVRDRVESDFGERIYAAKLPEEKLNIIRERDRYFTKLVVSNILQLPRSQQGAWLHRFNTEAAEHQERFLREGQEEDRNNAETLRRHALALETAMEPKAT